MEEPLRPTKMVSFGTVATKVIFDAPAPVPSAGPQIHPSRLLAVASTSSNNGISPSAGAPKISKPKILTAKQLAYKKKKTKKLKKMKQAAVRAAPKNKAAQHEEPEASGSGSSSTDEEEDQESETKKGKRKAIEDHVDDMAAPVEHQSSKKPKNSVKPSSQEADEDENEEEDDDKASLEAQPQPLSINLEETISLPAFPQFPILAPPSAASLLPLTVPAALKEATTVSPTSTLAFPTTFLSPQSESRLKEMGVENLFAVQSAVVPFLLRNAQLYPKRRKDCRDLCVSAPTGSGKTLSYVIPMVEVLAKRSVTRLRGLVILPTRDLVNQVHQTFMQYSKGRGLKIATATGQHAFAAEQVQLTGIASSNTPPELYSNPDSDVEEESILGGTSKVDILICTPGRLIDHLATTPGFSLQHLRFLVIDESDRLLGQSFQEWVKIVMSSINPAESLPKQASLITSHLDSGSVAPGWELSLPWEGHRPAMTTCQKLLFSATLTRDPREIASLGLREVKYFIVQDQDGEENVEEITGAESFAVPAGLQENLMVLPTALKPLHLIHLLHSPQYSLATALCFTRSVDASSRLVLLLQFFEEEWAKAGNFGRVVKGYSSDLTGSGSGGERKKILNEFKNGKVDLLVCSDLISRGIDVPSVSHVISYDIPVDMRKYVHRVGRTARAGKEGVAWSLVETQEARHFKIMLKEASHLQRVKKVKALEDDVLAPYRGPYEIALGRLKAVYDARSSAQ